jgi:hypothetical protein
MWDIFKAPERLAYHSTKLTKTTIELIYPNQPTQTILQRAHTIYCKFQHSIKQQQPL